MPSAQLNPTTKSQLPSMFYGEPAGLRESDRRLTIHRKTVSFHGGALQILGHAAEHLSMQLAFETDPSQEAATRQALHVLMQLSRSIFDEYAAQTNQERPVSDWLMRQAIRIYGAA
jgi:hypothetical protein